MFHNQMSSFYSLCPGNGIAILDLVATEGICVSQTRLVIFVKLQIEFKFYIKCS